MQLFNLPRRSGKTTLLVERLRNDPNAILIVSYLKIKRDLAHSLTEEQLQRVFTFDQVQQGDVRRKMSDWRVNRSMNQNRGSQPYVMIDEIDSMLTNLIGANVSVATTTSADFD